MFMLDVYTKKFVLNDQYEECFGFLLDKLRVAHESGDTELVQTCGMYLRGTTSPCMPHQIIS